VGASICKISQPLLSHNIYTSQTLPKKTLATLNLVTIQHT
jgi:hypothetical protein